MFSIGKREILSQELRLILVSLEKRRGAKKEQSKLLKMVDQEISTATHYIFGLQVCNTISISLGGAKGFQFVH